MLKTWIEQIKKSPDHYGVKYWKYNFSNNMLELSVQKIFREDELEYRNAIVSIGKVLHALRQIFRREGIQHHIQIFPNFDDSTLIAAIRTFSNSKTERKNDPEETYQDDPELVLEGLKNYAVANQLKLTKLKTDDLQKITLPEHTEVINWFALCADHENPFTWLRVGYWFEYLQNLKENKLEGILIVSDSELNQNRRILNGKVDNHYIQLLIGLPQSYK